MTTQPSTRPPSTAVVPHFVVLRHATPGEVRYRCRSQGCSYSGRFPVGADNDVSRDERMLTLARHLADAHGIGPLATPKETLAPKPKAEPTPGPYRTYGSLVYAPRTDTSRGGTICEVSEPRASNYIRHEPLRLGSPDADEAYANAHLLAASWTLREACKAAEEDLASLDLSLFSKSDRDGYRATLQFVRDALATADGS